MGKKLVQINTVCNGSTGNIMKQIQIAAKEEGYETLSFYGRRKGYTDLPCERFGSFVGFWSHVIWNTLTDRQGLASYFITKKMVARLREEKPDILHLHNLHGYYLHYPLLFKYLREEFKGKLFWTFHDCWPITGHCAYFTMKNCSKWQTECHHCPNKGVYPISWGLDSSKANYRMKKELFSGLEQLTILCPSVWMQEIVEKSFLKDTKSVVVSNGIDLDIFSPREGSRVQKKYHLPSGKKVLLGVAGIWEERKGLNTFLELAKKLSGDWVIVLVGLNKAQKQKMPSNVIGIERTEDPTQLAELYSLAAVFVNPSREESFSLVTIEAMACGTPVIALDDTAVRELITEDNGILLHDPEPGDYLRALEELERKELSVERIRKSVERYSRKNMTDQILKLYAKGDSLRMQEKESRGSHE